MNTTTFKVDQEYFTPEKTQEFLNAHEVACQKMEAPAFQNLYANYDLTFIEDYKEVIDSIINRLNAWKDADLETILLEVKATDSNCIFCEFGKSVKVYTWKYSKRISTNNLSRVEYDNDIGFRFEIKNGRLTEYGVCNAFR